MFPNLIRPAGFGASASLFGYSPTIAPLLGRSGMTTIVNAQQDDANVNVGDIGFDFPLYGILYRTNIFVGSNSYLTFGFGSSAYSSISRTSPGRALMVVAGDRSWTYVGAKADPSKYRIRFEGGASSSGGVPLIWEATLFSNGVIQLVVPIGIPEYGVDTLTKGDGVIYTDFSLTPNTVPRSFVFLPTDSAGSSHTLQAGSYG